MPTSRLPRGLLAVIWIVALGALFFLPLIRAMRAPAPVLPPSLGQVPAFSLELATGQPISSRQWNGIVWLAAALAPEDVATRLPALIAVERRCRFLASAFHVVLFTEAENALRLADKLRASGVNPRRWSVVTARTAAARAGWPQVIDALNLRDQHNMVALIDKHDQLRGNFEVKVTSSAPATTKNVAAFFRGSSDTSEDLVYAIGLLVNAP